MIAVILEFRPAASERALQACLVDAVGRDFAGTDGFLSIERFESVSEPGKLLSLSFWRDEAAVRRWQGQATRQSAHVLDGGLLRACRLRVASVARDYDLLAPPARRDTAA